MKYKNEIFRQPFAFFIASWVLFKALKYKPYI